MSGGVRRFFGGWLLLISGVYIGYTAYVLWLVIIYGKVVIPYDVSNYLEVPLLVLVSGIQIAQGIMLAAKR